MMISFVASNSKQMLWDWPEAEALSSKVECLIEKFWWIVMLGTVSLVIHAYRRFRRSAHLS